MVSRRGSYLDGRRALHAFDQRISDVRRALSNALDEVESADARRAEVRKEQAEAYSTLAQIRLDIVASGISLDDLEGAEREAHRLLEQHEDFADRQQARVEGSANEVEALEQQRRIVAADLDESIEDYEAKVEEIETALETDTAYLALADASEEASAIVARSEQKLELARSDRQEKGAPYDADPLFSYLWKRGFRTTEYKGRGLIKMLDGWVARIVKFDQARLNYARLTELPERLAEHVDRVKQEEQDAEAALEAAEHTALIDGGAVELETIAKAKRAELETLDKKIEAAETAHMAVVAEHEEVLKGGRGPAAEARSVLESALRQASFPDLRLLAAETIELDDDRIIDRLVKLRAEQMAFDLDDSELRRRPTELKHDLRSLETLRSEFKRARYDSPYASFKTSVIERVLAGVAGGQLDVGRAIRMLRKGLVQKQPRTPREFGGQRRSDTIGLPDVVGDILIEVLKQGGRGGWGNSGRARPIKRRSPRISPRKSSKSKSSGKKGGGFKTTGGF